MLWPLFVLADSANDMNTNAYKAAIHKVHERTIYESSNALPFYVRECGGGWACLESRHKDWRFYYLAITTRYTEPEVVLQWSLNPEVSAAKLRCYRCFTPYAYKYVYFSPGVRQHDAQD